MAIINQDICTNNNSSNSHPKFYIGNSFQNEYGTNNLVIPMKFTKMIDKYIKDCTEGNCNKTYFTDVLDGIGAFSVGICIQKKVITYDRSVLWSDYDNTVEHYIIYPGFACFSIRECTNNFMDAVISYIMNNNMAVWLSYGRNNVCGKLVELNQLNQLDQLDQLNQLNQLDQLNQCNINSYSNVIINQLGQLESLPILMCGFESNLDDTSNDFATKLALEIVQNYWINHKKFVTLWNNLYLGINNLDMRKDIFMNVSTKNPSVIIIRDIYNSYQTAKKGNIENTSLDGNKQILCSTLDSFADQNGLISIYVTEKSYDELDKEGIYQDE